MSETPCLEPARLRTVLATIALSVLTVIAAARPALVGRAHGGGPERCQPRRVPDAHSCATGTASWRGCCCSGWGWAWWNSLADALCVRYTRTLDYSVAHSPCFGLSPFWMPTAWMVVAAQIGYLGNRLMRRVGTGWGMALTALLGAVNIPFYEEMAYHAHWWRYAHCRMLGHTPLYIIVAELIIGLTLGPLAGWAMRRDSTWRDAGLAGLVGGLSTIWGGLIGYGLVERVL